MLRTSKIKELVSKTHPFMREFISPTKAVLYAFSDCIIKYEEVEHNLKRKEYLILEGKEINISKQPEGLEYGLERGFVFGFLDDNIFKFEDVENAEDKDILKEKQAKIKKQVKSVASALPPCIYENQNHVGYLGLYLNNKHC